MEYRIFGCKTNKYFTEKWFLEPGFAEKPGIFVASCVVTDQAKKKWVRFVRKAADSLSEGEKIYLSGCGAMRGGEIAADFYERYGELIWLREKIELLPEEPGTSANAPERIAHPLPEAARARLEKAFSAGIYTRKYLVVQTGCDNLCTFCLTIEARGKHRNRSAEEILREVRAFSENGGNEVVLTGTNIGAWGCEDSNRYEESRFVELLERILCETDIPRLRVSSLGVEFLSDRLLSLFQKKRLHAYVHLSVQSGSDSVLKRMWRKYGREFLLNRLSALSDLRREDGVKINVGADLIVGFPGETEADFEDTVSLFERFWLSSGHIFPFSPHEGLHAVPASRLPNQVSEKEKSARMERLLAAAERAKTDFARRNEGEILELLVENGSSEKKFSGWSENHLHLDESRFAAFANQEWKRGSIVRGKYRFYPDSGANERESDEDALI